MDATPAARRFPTRLFAFAFLGWAFDFYDLVLFGFIKDRVDIIEALLHLGLEIGGHIPFRIASHLPGGVQCSIDQDAGAVRTGRG